MFANIRFLEQQLKRRADGLAAIDLRFGWRLTGLDEAGDIVIARAEEIETGRIISIEADYLVGADGGNSIVRKALGIRLDDLDFEEPWLVVDAEVHGPVRFPDLWGVPPEAANTTW